MSPVKASIPVVVCVFLLINLFTPLSSLPHGLYMFVKMSPVEASPVPLVVCLSSSAGFENQASPLCACQNILMTCVSRNVTCSIIICSFFAGLENWTASLSAN